MANAAATESPTTQPATSKKGQKLLFIVLSLLLGVGAGGGFYFFQQSKAAAQSKSEKERKARDEDEKPKDADDKAGNNKQGEKDKTNPTSAALTLPDDSAVKQVIEMQPYIVNLADKGEARYLRLTISLGLGGEESEEKPGPLFTTRIRNALLAVLTSRTSEEVLTLEGKAKLRKDLLRAARAASTEQKVEAIYITEFIVQL